MDVKQEIDEVQKEKDVSLDDTMLENQYKVYNYFKAHIGTLITCVTALIAAMSVILHFAVGRMNYAYLEYWDIATLYANDGNQNEMQLVVCALLYMLAIVFIHSLLSKTSDTFRHYNKFLSRISWILKRAKKNRRELNKKIRLLSKKFNQLSPEERETSKAKEISQIINQHKMDSDELDDIKDVAKSIRIIRIRVIFQVVLASFLSYLIGSLFLVLLEPFGTIKEVFYSTRLVIYIVIFDLLLYFIPSYFVTRYSRKQRNKENTAEAIKEVLNWEKKDFPIEKVAVKGIKPILSDKALKIGFIQLVGVTFCLLIILFVGGTLSAKQNNSFPIYVDSKTSYAIVYFSDSKVFMEEAICQDETIIIDTSKQRIITTEDLSYNMVSFKNVIVNRAEDAQEIDQDTFFLKNIKTNIESFFEKVKLIRKK